MFKKKTLFIVGAGGSAELDFPMGEALKGQIARRLNIMFSPGNDLKSGDAVIVEALRQLARNINPYRQAGVAVAEGMALAPSIDNFLHMHAHDELMVLMGKLGIAASIMHHERQSKIAINGSMPTFAFDSSNFTWHARFAQMLLEGVPKDNAPEIFQNVSVITFNYDRCIEHYTAHALANQLCISVPEAQALAKGLEVIHPYGQVGVLPWRASSAATSNDFGTEPAAHNLLSITSQLRTFTERVEDADMLDRMHARIAEAETIVFLGFAFWPINMDLLAVADGGGPKVIVATSMGMSDPKQNASRSAIFRSFAPPSNSGTHISLTFENKTALQVLSDWMPLLSS